MWELLFRLIDVMCLRSGTAHVSYMKPFMCQKIWKQHLARIVTSVPKVLSKQRPAHPPDSSSESTFERLGLRPWQHPPMGSESMSVLSLDCLEGKCSNQERLWHQVQDQHQSQCLTYGTVSLIWSLQAPKIGATLLTWQVYICLCIFIYYYFPWKGNIEKISLFLKEQELIFSVYFSLSKIFPFVAGKIDLFYLCSR